MQPKRAKVAHVIWVMAAAAALCAAARLQGSTALFAIAVLATAIALLVAAVLTLRGRVRRSWRPAPRPSLEGPAIPPQQPPDPTSVDATVDLRHREQADDSVGASILEYASSPCGKVPNEDYAETMQLAGCNVMAIADGVSGAPRGDLAARAAVEGMIRHIEGRWQSTGRLGRDDLAGAFTAAHLEVRRRAFQLSAETHRAENPQTTLIAIIEVEDRFIVAYLGDGVVALYRAAGDLAMRLLFPDLPLAEHPKMMLVPHSEMGVLTRCIEADKAPPRPAYMEIDKALEGGEIVVAATDGALHPGTAIKTANMLLADIRRGLFDHVTNDELPSSTNKLVVRRILEESLERNCGDDNATLGVLITQRALRSWAASGQPRPA